MKQLPSDLSHFEQLDLSLQVKCEEEDLKKFSSQIQKQGSQDCQDQNFRQPLDACWMVGRINRNYPVNSLHQFEREKL